MLHHSDIVEEIATQRQGEIDAIDQYVSRFFLSLGVKG
jgi:hypothetical protein